VGTIFKRSRQEIGGGTIHLWRWVKKKKKEGDVRRREIKRWRSSISSNVGEKEDRKTELSFGECKIEKYLRYRDPFRPGKEDHSWWSVGSFSYHPTFHERQRVRKERVGRTASSSCFGCNPKEKKKKRIGKGREV